MGEVIVEWNVDKLNKDIEKFENVAKITKEMKISREGISRMVMLDRYSYKDTEKETIGAGDLVICTVKEDPNYPQRGVGIVQKLEKGTAYILIEEEYRGSIEDPKQKESGIIKRKVDSIDKPMEVYYEQISKRVAKGLSEVEVVNKEDSVNKFYEKLQAEEIVPAGRVLYGAGSGEEVTYFNCFVMPFPKDSREGLAEHRSEAMEIMSRGGGVGTNGSTLRPRDTLARGVNGKSSGSVSWLEDLSTLTHLIQQGK